MGAVSSAPIEAVRVQKQRGFLFSGAVAESQGWRDSHEDAHFMYQNPPQTSSKDDETGSDLDPEFNSEWATFGVLDGHGGTKSARLAAKILPKKISKVTKGREAVSGPGQNGVASAFIETDEELKMLMDFGEEGSGSTIIAAGMRKQEREEGGDSGKGDDSENGQGYKDKYTVFLANAGDSRGIILRKTGPNKVVCVDGLENVNVTGVSGEELEVDEEGVDPSSADYCPMFSKTVDMTIRIPNFKEGSKVDSMLFEGGKKNSQEGRDNKDLDDDDDQDDEPDSDKFYAKLVAESSSNETVPDDDFPISSPKLTIQNSISQDDDSPISSPKLAVQNAPDDEEDHQKITFRTIASIDHKPDRLDERRRIKLAGGWVSGGAPDPDEPNSGEDMISKRLLNMGDCARLDGNLAVSRGFADFQYKKDELLAHGAQKVSCVPELYCMKDVEAGNLILIACDGVFDVMSNFDLVTYVFREMARLEKQYAGKEIAREEILGLVCESVLRQCLILDSKDNMTMMIIQVGDPKTLESYRVFDSYKVLPLTTITQDTLNNVSSSSTSSESNKRKSTDDDENDIEDKDKEKESEKKDSEENADSTTDGSESTKSDETTESATKPNANGTTTTSSSDKEEDSEMKDDFPTPSSPSAPIPVGKGVIFSQKVILPGPCTVGSKLRNQLGDSRIRRMYHTFFDYLREEKTEIPQNILDCLAELDNEENQNSGGKKGKGKKGGGPATISLSSHMNNNNGGDNMMDDDDNGFTRTGPGGKGGGSGGKGAGGGLANNDDDLDFNDLTQLFQMAGVQPLGPIGVGGGSFFSIDTGGLLSGLARGAGGGPGGNNHNSNDDDDDDDDSDDSGAVLGGISDNSDNSDNSPNNASPKANEDEGSNDGPTFEEVSDDAPVGVVNKDIEAVD